MDNQELPLSEKVADAAVDVDELERRVDKARGRWMQLRRIQCMSSRWSACYVKRGEDEVM